MSTALANKEPLTEEEKSRITHLASLNYGPWQIAVLLGYQKRYFKPLALNEKTEIGIAYLKGRLLNQENTKQSLNNAMLDGNVTAAQTHIKQSESLDFENIKDEIFGL